MILAHCHRRLFVAISSLLIAIAGYLLLAGNRFFLSQSCGLTNLYPWWLWDGYAHSSIGSTDVLKALPLGSITFKPGKILTNLEMTVKEIIALNTQ